MDRFQELLNVIDEGKVWMGYDYTNAYGDYICEGYDGFIIKLKNFPIEIRDKIKHDDILIIFEDK